MSVQWTQVADNIFTTTWAYRRSGAIEQAFQNTPFAFFMADKKRVEALKGYRRIEINLDYGSTNSPTWVAKGDALTEVDNQFLTVAYEDWKYCAVNITRYWVDDQKNKGAAQIMNYVKEKLESAERALWIEIEQRLLGSMGADTKRPLGIQDIIYVPGASWNTLHGVDRNTFTWFRNYTMAATGAFSVKGIPDMRKVLNTLWSYRGVNPKSYVMVTDQITFEAYEDELLERTQIVNAKLSDLGYENYTFKGVTFLWSPYSAAASIYFINTDSLKLYYDADDFMQMTEWKPIPNRPNDRMAQIVAVMQLICNRPAVNGVLHSITY